MSVGDREGSAVFFLCRAASPWLVQYASLSAVEFGYRLEDFSSGRVTFDQLLGSEDRDRLATRLADDSAASDELVSEQVGVLDGAGRSRQMRAQYGFKRDSAGVVVEFEAVLTELSRESDQGVVDGRSHMFQEIIEAIPIPVFHQDLEGVYRGGNHAFREMLGLARDQIVGRTVHEVSSRAFAETYEDADRKLLENPGVQVYESKVRFGDGRNREIVFHKATFLDREGRVAGMVGAAVDQTGRNETLRALREAHDTLEARVAERTASLLAANEIIQAEAAERARVVERLRESEHRFHDLADSLPQTVFEVGADRRLSWMNPNGCRMFGLSPEDLGRGIDVIELIAPAHRVRLLEHWDPMMQGQVFDAIDILAQAVDGRVFPVLLSERPITTGSGRIEGVRGILVDISLRVQLERMKQDFLTIASHELRTPLTPLKLLVQQLQRRTERGELAEARALSSMDRQIRRLTEMVDGILDASRLERGTLALRPVALDLREPVECAVEDLRQQFPERRIELSLPERPVELLADAIRIEQVVIILVENALKYAPDSKVEVELHAKEHTAEIRVRDHGPGIPKEQAKSLFTCFYRTESQAAHHVHGLGLGLYISLEIARLHAGVIEVDSEPGRGSVFRVVLPLRALAEVAAESPPGGLGH